MSRRGTKLLKAALSVMHYTGADGLAAPFTRGNGVIFMLHRVTDESVRPFEPNRILKVTPDFLEKVITQVIESGFEIISIDELPSRIGTSTPERPFACFTLDDGYRDNLEYAYPVFKRYGVPFTIYVPTDYADGHGDLWWLTLEKVIESADTISTEIDGAIRRFDLASVEAKERAYEEIYWWLRRIPEDQARAAVAKLAEQQGFDRDALCQQLMMNWDELREMAADPLVTIGAHTCSHMALSKLDAEMVRQEIRDSILRIEQELGAPCRHFSYPYGCELSAGDREFAIANELGVATAVTTRKGLIDAAHVDQLAALPRFSLNGDYQDCRYIKVMLSGVPFRLWNAIGRVANQGPLAARSSTAMS
ncbi:MAG: polysaccharide deacetylase family protein [Hyphomicrobiaceae bacterium]|nr:polysaccharide deacetylase family protein [Hyphomicrobiaceae bacterium]